MTRSRSSIEYRFTFETTTGHTVVGTGRNSRDAAEWAARILKGKNRGKVARVVCFEPA